MVNHAELIHLIKNSGPKLLPFIKCVCIYFLTGAHNQSNEYWATILKCAPIVSLIVFIYLNGVGSSKRTYTDRILFGLIFSCLGDALLNHNYFPHGMGAFAVTQIFYIFAFGFQPLKLWIGFGLYAAGGITVSLLWSNLSSIILFGLPIYTILLVTMCWRATSLLFDAKNSSNILQIICAFASTLFVISDTMIAIDKYYVPISNSSVWIMATYYAAQFGITLSVIDLNKIKEI